MIRILQVLVLMAYMPVAFGLDLHFHFCKDKLTFFEIGHSHKESQASDGMQAAKTCCQDVLINPQIQGAQQGTKKVDFNTESNCTEAIINRPVQFPLQHNCSPLLQSFEHIFPPDIGVVDVCLFCRSFRI